MKVITRMRILILLLNTSVAAQTFTIRGKVYDINQAPVPGAIVKLHTNDSIPYKGVFTGPEGNFILEATNGNYLLKVSYLGYRTESLSVEVKNASVQLLTLVLKEEAKNLKEVEVSVIQQRGEQNGDTTQFNAGAFKVHQDATAEDLVKKMPGVVSDNNGLVVNGESVKKVLVDGQPFFGDDPNAAMKNLPADMIDKIQIFDQQSDQSQLTGFNDGNQQKTINIVTKKDKNKGDFGKIYAGYGTDNRYNAGANINSFRGRQRISLLFMGNNINQQNFSLSDIAGAMGTSGQRMNPGRILSGNGGRGGQGSAALLTTEQGGLTDTKSLGLNYTDAWSKRINVSASYFFNHTDNTNNSLIERNYFTDNPLVYSQNSSTSTKNTNHRANLRFEYNVDSANKLLIVPSLVFQNNLKGTELSGSSGLISDLLNSRSASTSTIQAFNFSNNVIYQHKFARRGRTIALNVHTDWNNKDNDGSYYNTVSDSLSAALDQEYTTSGTTRKISPGLTYTEPVGRNSQIMLSYNPSFTENISEKIVNDFNSVENDYSAFNMPLSNQYANIYTTHKQGIAYKYQKNALNFSVGADYQSALLRGNQDYPTSFEITRNFSNILPNASFRYQFKDRKMLNVQYRSTTNIPSVTQLQNVLDISNPLQVQSGNIELNQTLENTLSMRYGGFNSKTARNFFTFFSINNTADYISSSTTIFERDTTIQGYLFNSGSQLSKPVNLDDYWNVRLFAVYGLPLKAVKSNLNFNGGINYSSVPSILNNELNVSSNYAFTGGAYVGSNISSNVDFSIGYNLTYNSVLNSLNSTTNNQFFNHAVNLKGNFIVNTRLVFSTDLTYNNYQGLSQGFNQEYLLWNAGIGYKLLKDKSLEFKISAFDILKQNVSVHRTVNPSYIEDAYTNVLQRYIMFSLTYTFKSFKNSATPVNDEPPLKRISPSGLPPRSEG